MVNYTFNAISSDEVLKVKSVLSENFNIEDNNANEAQRELFNVSVCEYEDKLTVKGYETRTILIQGSSSGKFSEKVKATIRKCDVTEKEPPEATYDEEQIDKSIFLGFDESGKGECLGALFLGCTILESESVTSWNEKLSDKDAKDFSEDELNYWVSKIEQDSQVRTFVERVSALEIDKTAISINRLMDEVYAKILRENRESIASSCIVVDDYGVGDALTEELKFWKERGAKTVVKPQADNEYVCSKIASITARFERKKEIKQLKEENRLQQDGKIHTLKDGAANEDTIAWLKAYRNKYPKRRFPAFIRTSWKNVKGLEAKNPRRQIDMTANCNNCGYEGKLIYGVKRKNYVELFCASCGNLLPTTVLDEADFLFPDTNTMIIRPFSADITSKKPYFLNKNILLHLKIKQEIDNLGATKRTGANKELANLEVFHGQGKIHIARTRVPFRKEDFIMKGDRDHKIIQDYLKENNAVLMTADDSMASTTTGSFRIHFIYPDKWEYQKDKLLINPNK